MLGKHIGLYWLVTWKYVSPLALAVCLFPQQFICAGQSLKTLEKLGLVYSLEVASGLLFKSSLNGTFVSYPKKANFKDLYILKSVLSLFTVHFGVQLSQFCADQIWRLCVSLVHGWTWMVHDNLHRYYDTCCCDLQNLQR